MSNVKEKADKLIEEFIPLANTWDWNFNEPNQDKNEIKCAILSTENTIKVLDSIKHQIDYDNYNFIIQEQTELLTELKNRLL